MIIKKYTQEEFIANNDIFDACADIYESKYFLEDFDLDEYNNLTFFVYMDNDEIVGFGSYQDNEYCYMIETQFIMEYAYTEHHKILLKEILSNIEKGVNIFSYQSKKKDYEFYLDNGFFLYKDYGECMDIAGTDLTRYVLEYKKEIKK